MRSNTRQQSERSELVSAALKRPLAWAVVFLLMTRATPWLIWGTALPRLASTFHAEPHGHRAKGRVVPILLALSLSTATFTQCANGFEATSAPSDDGSTTDRRTLAAHAIPPETAQTGTASHPAEAGDKENAFSGPPTQPLLPYARPPATPEPTDTPGPPPPPYPITVTAGVGEKASEAVVSWDAVEGADHFRIGWIAASDYQSAEDDWMERFVYAEVSGKTIYTATRLTPGEYYYFVVGSANERYGQAQWSAWIGVMLNPAPDTGTSLQSNEPTDYDVDNNRLIEIATLSQLDAIRHDLNGIGASEHPDYLSAFPDAIAGMGCPSAGCVGYELTTDLDLDTDGDSQAGAGDDYWNDGAGWVPIGTKQQPFDADFHGNGHTISNLHINRQHQHVGLFGYIGPAGAIQQVGLEDADVSGFWDVGALAGWNAGIIKGSYATGLMSGSYAIGGLVGWNGGTIVSSNADGKISGVINNGGGLVAGTHSSSIILSSYASVSITGGTNLGGLVGEYRGGRINNSYATGNVQGSSRVGGFMGAANARGKEDFEWNNDEVANCYATGRVSGSAEIGGLIGSNELNRIAVRDSYWDVETSELSVSQGGVGKSTAELKTPTAGMGIYALWSEGWWDFGDVDQYPMLRSSGRDMALQQR